ncbi:hypothetical protein YB2330_006187 [Saitoella coloradoensis]
MPDNEGTSHTTTYDAPGETIELRRLHTGQMELGTTDVLAEPVSKPDVVLPPAVSQWRLAFEDKRPRWFREMFAEAVGCYFYVYAGVSTSIVFNLDVLTGSGGTLGSILCIGICFAIGVAFAIIIAGATSGGHLNPAFTVAFAVYQGFPWKKVPYYIFAQIFGCFMAALSCYAQYHEQIQTYIAAIEEKGIAKIGPQGVNTLFCAHPGPAQTNLGYVFLNEWMVDSYIAILVWAVLDPSNPFISPASAPYAIGLIYAVAVWGFAIDTFSANPARDLGARILTAMIWGGEAFPHPYSAIAALTPIPATLFGCAIYEFVFKDHRSIIKAGHMSHPDEHEELSRTRTARSDDAPQHIEVRVDDGKFR